MFCSKCGEAIGSDETICSKCGRPVPPLPRANPASIRHARLDCVVHRLGLLWYLFAALSAVLAGAGLFMVQIGQSNMAGPWEPWPHPPVWSWALTGASAWTLAVTRIVLAAAAGWGLMHRAEWGRIVAILAGILAITQFPMGAVLGVYTLAALIGKRQLYDQPI